MSMPTREYDRGLSIVPDPPPHQEAPRHSIIVPARSRELYSDRPGLLRQAGGQRMVDVFLRYLKEEGVRHVFGIPGGLIYPLMAAVEADEALTLVMPKHEEGAAF